MYKVGPRIERVNWNQMVDIPANTGHLTNAVSMLGQRRRRWANIEKALGECHVFAGIDTRGIKFLKGKQISY